MGTLRSTSIPPNIRPTGRFDDTIQGGHLVCRQAQRDIKLTRCLEVRSKVSNILHNFYASAKSSYRIRNGTNDALQLTEMFCIPISHSTQPHVDSPGLRIHTPFLSHIYHIQCAYICFQRSTLHITNPQSKAPLHTIKLIKEIKLHYAAPHQISLYLVTSKHFCNEYYWEETITAK